MKPAHRLPADTHGRGYLESRIAVDDGYIWPFDRPKMVSEGAITERMVEDIGALVNDGGEAAVVFLDDLTRLGWLPEQTRRCGARAFALFEAAHRKPRRRTTGNRSTVRRPDWRGQAACFVMLALPVALWARHLIASMA
ncbi:hypothetical protein FQV39_28620 [Bosea sp. F3-2]|uniref:hypothetical protein n=1 Tax=Bosea sp. F3-2 TaxID=2599640 RepID=UPI0011EEBC1E|nr:hypothetical protein [Bosea sp. F3-2]QEL26130.1 hypothetical protein FQV39_28620 [Bosea sp. F3-2]